MDLIAGITRWFLDPAHWQGSAGVPTRVGEHVLLCAVALLIAALIGLPAGIYVGHTGRGANLAVNLANLGRALPTLAVMGIVVPVTAAIDPQLGFKVLPGPDRPGRPRDPTDSRECLRRHLGCRQRHRRGRTWDGDASARAARPGRGPDRPARDRRRDPVGRGPDHRDGDARRESSEAPVSDATSSRGMPSSTTR